MRTNLGSHVEWFKSLNRDGRLGAVRSGFEEIGKPRANEAKLTGKPFLNALIRGDVRNRLSEAHETGLQCISVESNGFLPYEPFVPKHSVDTRAAPPQASLNFRSSEATSKVTGSNTSKYFVNATATYPAPSGYTPASSELRTEPPVALPTSRENYPGTSSSGQNWSGNALPSHGQLKSGAGSNGAAPRIVASQPSQFTPPSSQQFRSMPPHVPYPPQSILVQSDSTFPARAASVEPNPVPSAAGMYNATNTSWTTPRQLNSFPAESPYSRPVVHQLVPSPAFATSSFSHASAGVAGQVRHASSATLFRSSPAPQTEHGEPLTRAITPAEIMDREDNLQKLSASKLDWNALFELNHRVFGHHAFRNGQRTAVHAALTSKDAFILMPTGGGKSLCYQLPSIYDASQRDCTTFVVSPLVSLIQDQAFSLRSLGVNAIELTSNAPKENHLNFLKAVRGHARLPALVYLTPEKLSSSDQFMSLLMELYMQNRVARFVIDEAHCVSTWGHEFRQDYLRLGELRDKFPNVPIMALTATANRKTRDDIIESLKLRSPEILTLSFDRPNIMYTVKERPSSMKAAIEELAAIVLRHSNESGIIYCLSRKVVEEVAAILGPRIGEDKITYYHAGIEDPTIRQANHENWSSDRVQVIVATIAFGMGIDKPHVRYVVHFGMPKSITNFYQESGRAGRDGLPSESILLYHSSDRKLQETLINGTWDGSSNNDPATRARLLVLLRQMASFCMEQSRCRRVMLVEHFGESREPCGDGCDNCLRRLSKNTRVYTDMTFISEAVMTEYTASEGKFKERKTAKQWSEMVTAKLKAQGHFSGPDWPKDDASLKANVLNVIDHLVNRDCLQENAVTFNTTGRPITVYYLRRGAIAPPPHLELEIRVAHAKAMKQAMRANKRLVSISNSVPSAAAAAAMTTESASPLSVPALVNLANTDGDSTPDDADFVDGSAAGSSSKRKSDAAGASPSLPRLDRVSERRLFDKIKGLRETFAQEEGQKKAWMIYSDAVMKEMALRVPTTVSELLDIRGLGDHKVSRFGVRTLQGINDLLAELGGAGKVLTRPFAFLTASDDPSFPNSKKRVKTAAATNVESESPLSTTRAVPFDDGSDLGLKPVSSQARARAEHEDWIYSSSNNVPSSEPLIIDRGEDLIAGSKPSAKSVQWCPHDDPAEVDDFAWSAPKRDVVVNLADED